jgi:hypothetical protein
MNLKEEIWKQQQQPMEEAGNCCATISEVCGEVSFQIEVRLGKREERIIADCTKIVHFFSFGFCVFVSFFPLPP